MKKLLLASTILAVSAGAAAAEVTLSGDARMGIIDDFGAADVAFTSRARVTFTLSGESDAGFTFGASFRADNAGAAAAGTAGSVFVAAGPMKFSMGDVDGAAGAAMGQVDGVGLTGLSDLNEIIFIGNGGTDISVVDAGFTGSTVTGDPSALFEYSAGDFTIYASINQLNTPWSAFPTFTTDRSYAIAAAYSMSGYKIALGYERMDISVPVADTGSVDQLSLGADATFGGFTLKARYAEGDVEVTNGFAQENQQWAVSGTYTVDALALTAFVSDQEFSQGAVVVREREAYGLGASYDLGGGAKVVGGYVKNRTADTSAVDLGLSFAF